MVLAGFCKFIGFNHISLGKGILPLVFLAQAETKFEFLEKLKAPFQSESLPNKPNN